MNKELYARCLDDCLYPVYSAEKVDNLLNGRAPAVHDHNDSYYTKQENDDLLETVKRYNVDVTAAIVGVQAPTYSCSMTFDEILNKPGIPWLRYFISVDGETAEYPSFFCEMFRFDNDKVVFASGVDAAGVSHQITITRAGVKVVLFDAEEEFTPVMAVNETNAAKAVSAYAVQQYAQRKVYDIEGVLNYSNNSINITWGDEEGATAYFEAGAELRLNLTFKDAGMENVKLRIPLSSMNDNYWLFSTVCPFTAGANNDPYYVFVPIVRATFLAYGATIRKLSFAE